MMKRNVALWMSGVAFVTALVGCGGGEPSSSSLPLSTDGRRTIQAAAIEVPTSSVTAVIGLTKVNEVRISRTVYEYTFTVTAHATGPENRGAVRLSALSDSPYTTIIQGVAVFSKIMGGADSTSTNFITIRHDRSVPFDLAKLHWIDSTQKVTGKVIDGYIAGATVFWDCNGNQKIDLDEVTVTTDFTGSFAIDEVFKSGCDLAARVDAGAIDLDSPGQPITRPYTLLAAGNGSTLISPLSTMVAAKLKAIPGSTLVEATSIVTADLGLAAPPLQNYLADSNTPSLLNHNIAKSIVNSQSNYGGNLDGIQRQYVAIQESVSRAGGINLSASGVTPYYYRTYQTVFDALNILNMPNSDGFVIVKAQAGNNLSDDQFLSGIAQNLTARNAAFYGNIQFRMIDLKTAKTWKSEIEKRAIGFSDARLNKLVTEFRELRNTELAELNKKLLQPINDSTGFFSGYASLFTSDGRATFDYLIAQSANIISTEMDGIDYWMAGGPRTIINGGKYWYTKWLGEWGLSNRTTSAIKLKNRLEFVVKLLGSSTKLVQCGTSAANYLDNQTTSNGVAMFNDCRDTAAALATDFTKLQKFDNYKAYVGAGNALVGFGASAFANTVDEKWTLRTVLRTSLDFFDIFKELAALSNNPAVNRTISVVDAFRQYGEMILNAFDLADSAFEAKDKAIAEFDRQAGAIIDEYYYDFLHVYDGYFMVVDGKTSPYLTDITTITQADGSKLVEVHGANLSASYLASLGGLPCATQSVGGASSTIQRFLCPTTNLVGAALFDIGDGQIRIPGAPFWIELPPVVPVVSTIVVQANALAGVSFSNPFPTKAASCAITASGSWNNGPTATYGPDGAPGICGPGCKFPNAPSLALTMQRANGSYIVVGSSKTIILGANEAVSLSNNDALSVYYDNQGSVMATAACTPTALPPTDGSISVDAIVINGSLMTVPLGVSSCTFSASGSWSVIPNTSSGADGLPGQTFYQTKILNSPVGALVMRRPSQSTYTYVGTNKTLAVNSGEQLEFSADDGLNPVSYANNSGTLAVQYHCN